MREQCDTTLSIAQFGSTRSINAGAAAAIAMHTWVRQHVVLRSDVASRETTSDTETAALPLHDDGA
jgi:hypothetical protein